MSLRRLTDQALLEGAEKLANQSREVLTGLLHHLREIERRRLFSALKYQSLFDYVVRGLKFSEPEANRRISAMRLLQDLPEIEEKISTGALSMTNLVMARSLFLKEKKAGRNLNSGAKAEILSRLENQSTREAQKVLCSINPEMNPKTKALDFDSIEDSALREKLIRIKGLFAHAHPNMTLTEVLHRLCDNELNKKVKSPSAPKVRANASAAFKLGGIATMVSSKAEVTREVWRRAQSRCTNCGSTYAPQSDHIVPQAVGGPSTVENQRLLCRSCNQRAAIEYFGLEKMGRYLKSGRIEYYTVSPLIPFRQR